MNCIVTIDVVASLVMMDVRLVMLVSLIYVFVVILSSVVFNILNFVTVGKSIQEIVLLHVFLAHILLEERIQEIPKFMIRKTVQP